MFALPLTLNPTLKSNQIKLYLYSAFPTTECNTMRLHLHLHLPNLCTNSTFEPHHDPLALYGVPIVHLIPITTT